MSASCFCREFTKLLGINAYDSARIVRTPLDKTLIFCGFALAPAIADWIVYVVCGFVAGVRYKSLPAVVLSALEQVNSRAGSDSGKRGNGDYVFLFHISLSCNWDAKPDRQLAVPGNN